MPIDGATVEKFFEQMGWNYTRLDDNAWRMGVRGRLRDFTIVVRLIEAWLLIQTGLLNEPNPGCHQQLYQHLLRLNFQMNMAKFGLGSDGEIVLMVEMPIEELNFSEFQTGLLALSTYAERYFLEIANLATNPHARSSLALPEAPEGDEKKSDS